MPRERNTPDSLRLLHDQVAAAAAWDRREDLAVEQVDSWLSDVFGPRPVCVGQVMPMLQHLLGAEVIDG